MFLCHSAFNTLHRLYCNQSGRIVGFDEMTKLNSKEFVEAIFSIQSRIQKLMLTQEEICLVGSLAIMLTGKVITFAYLIDHVIIRVVDLKSWVLVFRLEVCTGARILPPPC